MKPIHITILAIALFLLLSLILGAYLVVDRLFPKAPPIPYPAAEDVITIQTRSYWSEQSDHTALSIEADEQAALLELIAGGQATRKMSVQDTPGARGYYSIEITTEDRTYCYFVYKENGTVYIELPYEGIYIAEDTLLDTIWMFHGEN